jgi:hypothetical protein
MRFITKEIAKVAEDTRASIASTHRSLTGHLFFAAVHQEIFLISACGVNLK